MVCIRDCIVLRHNNQIPFFETKLRSLRHLDFMENCGRLLLHCITEVWQNTEQLEKLTLFVFNGLNCHEVNNNNYNGMTMQEGNENTTHISIKYSYIN